MSESKQQTIPDEQYEHISKAMDALGKLDSSELPQKHAMKIEQFWGYLDDLYLMTESAQEDN